MGKKKIGIVVQRYGAEINDGAELHAKMVAEKLAAKYDVTVLTSCAFNPVTWQPHYPAGETVVNGIKVIRFHNTPRQYGKQAHYINRKFRERHLPQKIFRWLGRPKWYSRLFSNYLITDKDGEKWLVLHGPGMPDLLPYLKAHEKEMAAFIFFSAVYYPAAMGILTVPHKSIVVPTIHDDPPAYFPIYKKVMASARWILFNTKAEQEFSERLYPISHVNKRVVAVGVAADPESEDASVLQKFGIDQPYIFYIGRIDEHKGCDTLIEYFTKAVDEHRLDVQLVLAGKLMMERVGHPAIIYTGMVSEKEKAALMKFSAALVIASLFESLSLVLLESFACKTPVIATAKTQVLKDHVDDSGGGWVFDDANSFGQTLQQILADPAEAKKRGEAGYRYLLANYTWEKVLPQFDEAIASIEKENS